MTRKFKFQMDFFLWQCKTLLHF